MNIVLSDIFIAVLSGLGAAQGNYLQVWKCRIPPPRAPCTHQEGDEGQKISFEPQGEGSIRQDISCGTAGLYCVVMRCCLVDGTQTFQGLFHCLA